MSAPKNDMSTNKLLADAVVQIRSLKKRVRELENMQAEPIAIIGMSCVFPEGMEGADNFWNAVQNGLDAIEDMGNRRWDMSRYYSKENQHPGKMYTRRAGLVRDIHKFDAEFFGIAPREADNMDPQQRLVLATAWEALEDSAIAPESLEGSDTGVFIGAMNRDYIELQLALGTIEDIGGYVSSGNISSVLSGRLSYQLGLKGPCVSLDTACSSSLTAIHLAAAALREGESNIALAGGVNAIVTPSTTIAECKANMLSPDGFCKTFDAGANGYVRSEGCGMVVLKRLSQALADGDPIRAVIRGSAVNQDGRSQGLTAPNGPSQQAVIRAALTRAGVSPSDVSYVEAHGTGTPLGDPIEVQALDEVYGDERQSPLWLGSVKTNIGHAESAAGVAGLIKVILSMEHKQLPPHLHFNQLNPHITMDPQRLRLPLDLTPWQSEGPRLAGLSSFGFSGTNAHMIVEEAPVRGRDSAASAREQGVLCLSAKTPAALTGLVEKYQHWLASEPDVTVGDVCYTAAVGRSHFTHRLAVTGNSLAALKGALESVSVPETSYDSPSVSWLFSGQGSQHAGMGQGLYQDEAVFREAMDQCAQLLEQELDVPLTDLLWGASSERLSETRYTQPALFALEYSLAMLWQSWGHTPAVLMGHSVGEYAAACVAGVFSLADGLRLIAARGRLMDELTSPGRMVVLFADASRVESLLDSLKAELVASPVAIAAYNGPQNVVVSGGSDGIARVLAEAAELGMNSHELSVSRAFHSPLMAPMLSAFREVAASVTYHAPGIRLVSNVTGREEVERFTEVDYWVSHIEAPVAFAKGMDALSASGVEVYVELGPDQTLVGMGRGCGIEAASWLPSLLSDDADTETLVGAVAGLYAVGHGLDWSRYYAGRDHLRVHIPTYAFDRKPYWLKGHNIEVESEEEASLADWFYEIHWQTEPRAEQEKSMPSGRWLVFSDNNGVVGEALSDGDLSVTQVSADICDAGDPEAVLPYLQDGPYDGIVYAWALDSHSNATQHSRQLREDERRQCGGLLHLVQGLLQVGNARREDAPLIIVTQGAQQLNNGEEVSISQAEVVGMAKVIATEHPELNSRHVDVQPGDHKRAVEQLRWCLSGIANNSKAIDSETFAMREGELWVPYLCRQNLKRQFLQTAVELDTEGQYLIVGGTGGLGFLVALWLLANGVNNIWLISRSGKLDGSKKAQLDTYKNADVEVLALDVGEDNSIAYLEEKLKKSGRPLSGVFHSAGVLDDGTIATQSMARFEKVTQVKVSGLWNLHKLCENKQDELKLFVIFSSVASIVGTAGQVNYVAANAFIDAFAVYLQRKNQKVLTINWGAWAETGMAVSKEAQQNINRNQIFQPIEPEKGMQALEYLINAQMPCGIVSPIDWDNFTQFLIANTSPIKQRFFQQFIHVSADSDSENVNKFSHLSESEINKVMTQEVAGVIRGIMNLDDSYSLDNDRPLQEIGLDSLMALEVRNSLSKLVDKKLPVSLLFDYPSINQLADTLSGEVIKVKSEVVNAIQRDLGDDDIAIIGIACHFPGMSEDTNKYWEFLKSGESGIEELENKRWSKEKYFDREAQKNGKTYLNHAGLLHNVQFFDAEFFGLSPIEAKYLDPQQRFLLEHSWAALEDAGYSAKDVAGTRTGVYVGLMAGDYAYLWQQMGQGEFGPYLATGNALSTASGRISYTLGLEGPSLSIDTACSSSLVAVHQACQTILNGETEMALAGGVNMLLYPANSISLSQAGMLAPDGFCKTFDAGANGYVRSEGCGMVVLKRLSQALADGDPIRAVIRGSAVNQDGRSQGLTAPNGPSQQAVIRAALTRAGVSPSDVSYVEAHGTGTPLGDPIEVQALDEVYGDERQSPLWLGSVKTNIGHAESAAGVAGLIKVILSMEHKQLPPHLHFNQLNPHITMDPQRLRLPLDLTPWQSEGPRLAGLSSFGFSGTNAHMIVEEAPVRGRDSAASAREQGVLCLSAKTPAALTGLVEKYQHWLASEPDVTVGDVCYTAAVGRSHFNHRLAVTGNSLAALKGALESVSVPETSYDSPSVAWLFSGQGAQYAGMGQGLYQDEAVFREAMDQCAQLLEQELDVPLTDLLWGASSERLSETRYTQPALFALEYSLAMLWQSWGHTPAVLMGHSVGEYAAACVAGVFSLADGLRLIAARGRLMDELTSPGRMVVLFADASRVESLLDSLKAELVASPVAIAAYNGPQNVVVSGGSDGIARVLAEAAELGMNSHELSVSRAFHSPLMAPMLSAFREVAASVTYHAPGIRLVSNVTGREEVERFTEVDYWVSHIEAPVAFAKGMDALSASGVEVYVELGPDQTLVGMGRGCGIEAASWLPSLLSDDADTETLVGAVAGLYAVGHGLDWSRYYAGRDHLRVHIPTYAFDRKPYWLKGHNIEVESEEEASLADWFYEIHWQTEPRAEQEKSMPSGRWLVFSDNNGVVGEALSDGDLSVTQVSADICDAGDPEAVLPYLQDGPYDGIVYAWALDSHSNATQHSRQLREDERRQCGGLLHLVQGLLQVGNARREDAPLIIVTQGAQQLNNGEEVSISQAEVVGMAKVIATEHPELNSRHVDVQPGDHKRAVEQLRWCLSGIANNSKAIDSETFATRENNIFLPQLSRVNQTDVQTITILDDARYLISGGTGGLGLAVAQWLIDGGARKLDLIARKDPMTLSSTNLAKETITRWRDDGIDVAVITTDLSTSKSVALLAEHVKTNPIAGVFHLAGANQLDAVKACSYESFETITGSKLLGGWHLQEALEVADKADINCFVTFSSIASVWGSAKMLSYTAANEAANALMDYRRTRKQHGVSIQWGPWGDSGMAAGDYVESASNIGLAAFSSQQGIAAMVNLIATDVVRPIVVSMDWNKFIPIFDDGGRRHLFKNIVATLSNDEREDSESLEGHTLEQELVSMSDTQKLVYVQKHLLNYCISLLELDHNSKIQLDTPLHAAGIDSILSIQLASHLNKQFSKKIVSTIIFDSPTIEQMSHYLIEDLIQQESVEADEDSDFSSLLDQVEKLTEEDLDSIIENI